LDVSATLFVVNEAWRPGVGIMVRLTDPENPPRLVRVISDVDWIPACVLIDEGPLGRKSTTVTEMIIECDKLGDVEVPVTCTVKVPATVETTVRVEMADALEVSVALGGFRLAALLGVESDTVPWKLLTLVIVS
jgi:hypothetical protein